MLVGKRPSNSGKSTIFGGRSLYFGGVFGESVPTWKESSVKAPVSSVSARCSLWRLIPEPPIIVHLPEFTPGFPTSRPREGRKRSYGEGRKSVARGVTERAARGPQEGLRKGPRAGRKREGVVTSIDHHAF